MVDKQQINHDATRAVEGVLSSHPFKEAKMLNNVITGDNSEPVSFSQDWNFTMGETDFRKSPMRGWLIL